MECPSCKGNKSFTESDNKALEILVRTHGLDCTCMGCVKYNRTIREVKCELCNVIGVF